MFLLIFKKNYVVRRTFILLTLITIARLLLLHHYNLLFLEEFLSEWYVRKLVVRVRVEEPLRDIHRVVDGVVQDWPTKLLRNQLRVRVQHLQDVCACNRFAYIHSVNGEEGANSS